MPDRDGRIPLLLAARKGNLSLAKTLLERCCDQSVRGGSIRERMVVWKSNDGQVRGPCLAESTIFLLKVHNCFTQVLPDRLRLSGDYEHFGQNLSPLPDHHQLTPQPPPARPQLCPMFGAVRSGNLALCEYLYQAGAQADVSWANNFNNTCLYFAGTWLSMCGRTLPSPRPPHHHHHYAHGHHRRRRRRHQPHPYNPRQRSTDSKISARGLCCTVRSPASQVRSVGVTLGVP